jgi:putative flavoprotein involved in K+ transport
MEAKVQRKIERVQTVIVGAGQSGLSVGYHLKQRGLPFVILDANARVGDTWRKRWDSLRLFTPARYDALVGMPFPAPGRHFPTKDEMGDYLESYARHFQLPVRSGVTVQRVAKKGNGFLISAGETQIEAEHVVVAMATFQKPTIPAFAAQLWPDIVQLHSSEYRNPSQLQPGAVLLVGAGNSGAEIAVETASKGFKTYLSGRHVGHVPFRLDSVFGHYVVAPVLLRFVFNRILTTDTPVGRKAQLSARQAKGTPLIRLTPEAIAGAGVERTARMIGARAGMPLLDGGRVLDVSNVIWCTGFHPGFSWIDVPAFDDDGHPAHVRGISTKTPGLYFTGLHFLYSMSSTMIHGAARDAAYIANAVANAIAGGETRRLRPATDAENEGTRYVARA